MSNVIFDLEKAAHIRRRRIVKDQHGELHARFEMIGSDGSIHHRTFKAPSVLAIIRKAGHLARRRDKHAKTWFVQKSPREQDKAIAGVRHAQKIEKIMTSAAAVLTP